MRPGQLAHTTNSSKELTLSNVNTYYYTSWREGKLFFRGVKFKKIMQQLERHFGVDIDVAYTAILEDQFSASFSGETVEQILNFISNSTPFSYQLKGKKITINKP
jgi:ferric-dicitrate binding protein FerR (iron transport regulator)